MHNAYNSFFEVRVWNEDRTVLSFVSLDPTLGRLVRLNSRRSGLDCEIEKKDPRCIFSLSENEPFLSVYVTVPPVRDPFVLQFVHRWPFRYRVYIVF